MNLSKLLSLAEQGDPQSQYELGLHFVNPSEGTIDVGKAFFWFSESAKQGLADAQYHLADFYENLKRDLPNAIKWYRAAAEQGHLEAQSTLGYFYESGLGVEVDFDEAAKWHKKAAEQGLAVAQNNLARCYEHGNGVPMDLSEAIKWYTMAAEQGSPLPGVQNDLGLFYMTGKGIPVNTEKAVYWFTKAVEHNEIPAFANLGRCYLMGIGVNKDIAEALKFFSVAIRHGIEDIESFLFEHISVGELATLANAGNAQAEYFLSRCYISGSFLERNMAKAIDLLDSSSEKGEPLSMVFLGCICSEGKYIARNLFKAEELFAKATELGHKDAAVFLNEVRMLLHFHAPYYLVKVADRKWAEKFMDGEVFMRAISCFAPIENWLRTRIIDPTVQNTFRGDNMEGFTKSYGEDKNPFGIFSNSDTPPDSFGLIDMRLLREKIFCLYSYEFDETEQRFIKPDPQLVDFGDTAVIITDTKAFLERVSSEIKSRFGNLDYYMAYRRVTYDIDLSSNNAYSEFSKSKDYLWQKEFRIALDLSEGRIDKITLDSVTDFALLQYLDSCGKVGLGRPATRPLTEEEMQKYDSRDFRGMIDLDENPDSINDSLTLCIGDIRDICVAVPTCQFVDMQTVDYFIEKGCKSPALITPHIPKRQPQPTFFKSIAQFSPEQMNMITWREKWREEGLTE